MNPFILSTPQRQRKVFKRQHTPPHAVPLSLCPIIISKTNGKCQAFPHNSQREKAAIPIAAFPDIKKGVNTSCNHLPPQKPPSVSALTRFSALVRNRRRFRFFCFVVFIIQHNLQNFNTLRQNFFYFFVFFCRISDLEFCGETTKQ